MNKKLKFSKHLAPLILSGEKYSTWRMWDDKDLKLGDTIDFLHKETNEIFATGKVVRVAEKQLGKLSKEDKKGHEKFKDDEEMYNTFSKYYSREVNSGTIVKIIWFDLI